MVVRSAPGLLPLLAIPWILCACGGQEAAPERSASPDPARMARAPAAEGPVGPPDGGRSAALLETAARDLGAAAILRQSSHLFVERDVSVLTRRPGIVRAVRAQRGERVRAGQVLCELENRDLALAVEVARLDADQARASFDRANRLDREAAISKEAYEAAEFKLRSAERAAEIAAQEFEKTFLRAPFDGVISARNVEIGQVLADDDTRALFRVTALSPLLARFYLPQWAYRYLREGDRILLRPDTSPDSPVEGRVRWVNDVLDAASGSAEVLVEAGVRETGDLRPGMSVVVEMRLAFPPGRLTVARQALRESTANTDEAEVTVRRGGVDWPRRVRLGFRGDDRVEILSGLEAGEEVVLPGGADSSGSGAPAGAR